MGLRDSGFIIIPLSLSILVSYIISGFNQRTFQTFGLVIKCIMFKCDANILPQLVYLALNPTLERGISVSNYALMIYPSCPNILGIILFSYPNFYIGAIIILLPIVLNVKCNIKRLRYFIPRHLFLDQPSVQKMCSCA